MFFVPINIPIFRFSPSQIFLHLLVPIKFSITTFSPYTNRTGLRILLPLIRLKPIVRYVYVFIIFH